MLAEWEARGFSDAQIVTLLVTMLWIVSQDGRVPEHRCPLCCAALPASWRPARADDPKIDPFKPEGDA